jgi:hypothetical protein
MRPETKTGKWWGNSDAARLWMRQLKAKFPDWSYEWEKEKAKRRYHALPQGEKDAYNLRCRERDPERRKATLEQWKKANPDRVRAANAKAVRKHRQNPANRPVYNLRNRLREFMASVKAGGNQGTWRLIGCSSGAFAAHLESQFKRGMTWENYGTHWHVDHILPCSSFDHTDPAQVKQCWHWTNLRPLEAPKNLAKGAKIKEPQLSLLLCS